VWIILTARADCKKDPLCSYTINGHWIGGIVIAVTFGFMAFGIFTRFGWMVLCNTTTIEEVQAYHPRHCLAVRIDESELPRRSQTIGPEALPPLFWVTYPFPNIYGGANGTASGSRHLYVILMPKQGMNFWNVGYWRNFKSLMGERWWDWFLPIRYSPFVRHEDGFSDFELGKDFETLEKLYLPHRYGSDGRRGGASRSTERTNEK
jgi:palmitoyltransferase